MRTNRGVRRPELIEFFLRLWGLWQGVIDIPPPPKPPFDIDTFEPIIPLERAIKQWVPNDEPPDIWYRAAGLSNDWNQSRPDPILRELGLSDGRILVSSFEEINRSRADYPVRLSLAQEGQTVFSLLENPSHDPITLPFYPEKPPCSP